VDLTALDESIERLTDEVRGAKQECLALFVSLQVSAEELRQTQDDIAETEQLARICRQSEVVSFHEYKGLMELHVVQRGIASSTAFHVNWESGSELAGKLTRYRELLAQLNQHLEVAAYSAPIIEFRRDYRRSNRPPTH
jgi:hypothetical protein